MGNSESVSSAPTVITMKLANRSKATYVNIFVFLFVFCLVSYFTVPVKSAAPNGSILAFFTLRSHWTEQTLLYARQFCVARNFDQFLNLVARVYTSSFIKDALFATLAPRLGRTAVSSKLINKVERDTFNEDWIPASNYDQFARKSMLTKSVVDKGHVSRKTSVYIIGHGLIKFAINLTQLIGQVFLKLVLMSQWGLAYSTNGIIGILFFTIRSVFCSISSTSLMLLHLVQIALRTTRMVYNLIEIVLSRCCAIVNDCSLLSIDVIRAARVNHGEKTFTQLADKGPFGQGDGQNE